MTARVDRLGNGQSTSKPSDLPTDNNCTAIMEAHHCLKSRQGTTTSSTRSTNSWNRRSQADW